MYYITEVKMDCKFRIDYIERGLKVASILVLLIVLLGLLVLPQRVYATPGGAATPTVSGDSIYANGTTIFITGSSATSTTIHIDTNNNGVYDAGTDQSLHTAGITNAPSDSANLSSYAIYGGYQSDLLSAGTTLTGNTNIIMIGGGVQHIIGGGNNTTVDGDTNITVSGGTVATSILGGGGTTSSTVTGSKNITVSGNPKIGDGNINGIEIGTANDEVTNFKIGTGGLSTGALVYAKLNGSFNDGATIASGAVAGDAQYIKAIKDIGGYRTYFESNEIKIAPAPMVNLGGVLDKSIFANGFALIINGTGNSTTVYVDKDRDGVIDAEDLSLEKLNIANAPADNADLGEYIIFGGYENSSLTADNTKITMLGGTVSHIYGGGDDGDVSGNASVIISGGTVRENVYGGGRIPESSVGSSSVNITGGTIGHNETGIVQGGNVYGAGYQGKVVGNASVTIIGGTVMKNVYGGGVLDTATAVSKTITVGGTAKIGDSANGIRLGDNFNEVETFVVGDNLQVGAQIYVVTNDAYTAGSTIATGAVEGDIGYIKLTLPNAHYNPYLDGTDIKMKIVPTVDGKLIFANGAALLIVKDDDIATDSVTETTIYIDDNRNGVRDSGEKSLSGAGITGAPVDQSDLSLWTISGGNRGDSLIGDTLITMTGGSVDIIYGGSESNQVDGDTHINMTGGSVTYLYGGGITDDADVTGSSNITVTGGNVRSLYTEGRNDGATVGGNKNVTVGGTAKVGINTDTSSGIKLGTGQGVVEFFTIAPDLTADAEIYLYNNDGYNLGDKIATGAVATDLDNIILHNNTNSYPIFISNFNTGDVIVGYLPTTGTSSGSKIHEIYGNGNALIIAADGTGTTVYIDIDRDGILDPGEPSLKQAGVADAPADGADLSYWSIFGGSDSKALTANTMITMIGGSVNNIYGGNNAPDSAHTLTGDISITVTGGSVVNVRGGNNGGTAAVTGTKTVTVGGDPKIGDVDGYSGIYVVNTDPHKSSSGVLSFKIDNLAPTAEVYVYLIGGFPAKKSIATGAQRGDELLMRLDNNPNDYGAYLDGTEIKVGTLPTITTQPTGATYVIGTDTADITPLKVESDDTGVTYQWYKSSTNSTRDGTAITGEIDKTYTPPTDTDGTTYYYCLITGADNVNITSGIAAVTIQPIQIIKGGNQTIVQGDPLSVTSNDHYDSFEGDVMVDGKPVGTKYFSSSPGSINITLSGAYTETLSLGRHTLSIQGTGMATTEFDVVSKPPIATTDPIVATDPSISPLTGVYDLG